MPNFSIFPFGSGKISLVWVKDGSASYLLQVKSTFGLDRVRAHLHFDFVDRAEQKPNNDLTNLKRIITKLFIDGK